MTPCYDLMVRLLLDCLYANINAAHIKCADDSILIITTIIMQMDYLTKHGLD